MQSINGRFLIAIGLVTAGGPSTCLFLGLNMLFFVPLLVGLATIVAAMLEGGKWFRTLVTLCLIASVGPFVLHAYYAAPGKPIRIVLPVGFRGEFTIVKDRQRGEELRLSGGAWEFRIPANGVLLVKKDHPFYRWHKAEYTYADGSLAVVKPLGLTAGSIRTGPNRSESSSHYDGTTHRYEALGPADLPVAKHLR